MFNVLEELVKTIRERKNSSENESYTKKLLMDNNLCREKVMEEINELIEAKNRGFDIYLAFIIQREDCKKFKIAEDIDPKYKKLLTFALKNKLKVICYDCKFLSKGIIVNNQVNFLK